MTKPEVGRVHAEHRSKQTGDPPVEVIVVCVLDDRTIPALPSNSNERLPRIHIYDLGVGAFANLDDDALRVVCRHEINRTLNRAEVPLAVGVHDESCRFRGRPGGSGREAPRLRAPDTAKRTRVNAVEHATVNEDVVRLPVLENAVQVDRGGMASGDHRVVIEQIRTAARHGSTDWTPG